VVNAMLEEIQGIVSTESVITIGATNYLEKVDPALRRAGRLDQIVHIPLPSIDGLERIFKYHLDQVREEAGVSADVDLRTLAVLAFGLTGADVEFFVRGAARRARHENRPIGQADLLAEVTRLPRRPDSIPRLGVEELHRVAVHEAGHALARLMSSSGGEDLTFISIIPRSDGTLGFVASAPSEARVATRRTMLQELETALAGRAAEAVVFGADDVSTGSGGSSEHSDLAMATRTATYYVCQSGLGETAPLLWTTTPTPDQMARVGELLDKAYSGIVARLELKRELVLHIAGLLEQQQEISGDELRQLVRGDEA
jgi:ATP-dependent Zn protease